MFMLDVPMFKLYVPMFMLYVPMFTLHVPMFMLHVPIFMLHVPMFMLHVPMFPAFLELLNADDKKLSIFFSVYINTRIFYAIACLSTYMPTQGVVVWKIKY